MPLDQYVHDSSAEGFHLQPFTLPGVSWPLSCSSHVYLPGHGLRADQLVGGVPPCSAPDDASHRIAYLLQSLVRYAACLAHSLMLVRAS